MSVTQFISYTGWIPNSLADWTRCRRHVARVVVDKLRYGLALFLYRACLRQYCRVPRTKYFLLCERSFEANTTLLICWWMEGCLEKRSIRWIGGRKTWTYICRRAARRPCYWTASHRRWQCGQCQVRHVPSHAVSVRCLSCHVSVAHQCCINNTLACHFASPSRRH